MNVTCVSIHHSLNLIWSMDWYLCRCLLCWSQILSLVIYFILNIDVRVDPVDEMVPLKTIHWFVLISDIQRKWKWGWKTMWNRKMHLNWHAILLKSFYLSGLFCCFGLETFKVSNKRLIICLTVQSPMTEEIELVWSSVLWRLWI